MYEPPNTEHTPESAPASEIDQAMDAFIAEAQKEFTPEPLMEEATAAPEAKVEPKEQVNTVEPTPEPTEKGLERLVAREVELRERETRLSGAEKEMEALRTRLREVEQRALTPELLDKIRFSPAEGLRTLGLDPDEVVRMALVEKLGDKVNDPETRALLERSKIRREMETLKAQVQDAERQRAAQAYYTQISNGAADYVRNTEGVGKHAPTVASVAKGNPERVFQEIMEEITRDAQFRSARGEDGDVLSYEEAARRVETRWSGLKALFSGPTNPELSPATHASTPTPKTPENTVKEPQKSPPSTIKPPDKPLAPWLQRKVDEEEALKMAMDEWKRVEGLNR